MTKVRDFMTTHVVTVNAQDELAQAARLMRDSDIGALAVMDGATVRGIVTDRDLVIRGLAEGRPAARLGEIITGGLISVSPDDDEKEVERQMSGNEVRRLPVLDENGQLVGIVSVGDLASRDDKRAGKVMEKTGPGD